MSDRKFICAERGKYFLEEKDSLGKWCKKTQREYEAKGSSKKLNYDDKMKKHTKKHHVKHMLYVLFERSIQTWKKLSTVISISSQPLSLVKDIMNRW